MNNKWLNEKRSVQHEQDIYRSNKHFRIYSVNLIPCRFFPRSCFPFRLLLFFENPPLEKHMETRGHKGFYDNYGKKRMGMGNNEGLGRESKRDVAARFVTR